MQNHYQMLVSFQLTIPWRETSASSPLPTPSLKADYITGIPQHQHWLSASSAFQKHWVWLTCLWFLPSILTNPTLRCPVESIQLLIGLYLIPLNNFSEESQIQFLLRLLLYRIIKVSFLLLEKFWTRKKKNTSRVLFFRKTLEIEERHLNKVPLCTVINCS